METPSVFDPVMHLLDWAKKQGYAIPLLPYALKKRNKPAIVAMASACGVFNALRWKLKRFHKKIAGNSPEQQARRYGQQRI